MVVTWLAARSARGRSLLPPHAASAASATTATNVRAPLSALREEVPEKLIAKFDMVVSVSCPARPTGLPVSYMRVTYTEHALCGKPPKPSAVVSYARAPGGKIGELALNQQHNLTNRPNQAAIGVCAQRHTRAIRFKSRLWKSWSIRIDGPSVRCLEIRTESQLR